MRRLLAATVLWRAFGPVLHPRFPPGQCHPWRIPARTVFVGDREFLVRQAGPDGAPDVVLIHGLGGSSLAEWYEVGSRLSARFRLTIVDNRSHGLSPRETARYDVEDLADDVAAVMSEAGVDRADVVGYSMGGAIAQALAHRWPHRVRRLVLIGSFSSHPPAWRIGRMVGAFIVRAFERLTGIGTPEVRAGYLLLTGAVRPEHARWMWAETHRRDPEAGAAANFALFRFDADAWIRRIDAPCLVVIPCRDRLVPARWQYELAARMRNVRVRELPDARHEAPWTHPGEIAEAIIDFLGGAG